MTSSANGDTNSKSIPIRCLIETASCDSGSTGSGKSQAFAFQAASLRWLERECFAIVPGSSLFRNVVKTVLLKLGYSDEDVSNSKGSVQIKNWRALDLEYITDNTLASVEDILADLTTVATLRIKIFSGGKDEDVKDKLLLMLLAQSNDCLQRSGCPLTKEDVENVIAGKKEFGIGAQSAFYSWYSRLGIPSNTKTGHRVQTNTNCSGTASGGVSESQSISTEPPLAVPGTKTTRLRISFDSEEVARLQRWFDVDPHPSRQQMTSYLAELNSLPVRSALKPLDLTNIMYWFKNARAAARRNGRSVTSDDLSDDEDRQSEKEGSTMSAPPLPNSNAVYMITDPLVKDENNMRKEDDQVDSAMSLTQQQSDEESDLEEDLSVTDDYVDDEEEPGDESKFDPSQLPGQDGETQRQSESETTSHPPGSSPSPPQSKDKAGIKPSTTTAGSTVSTTSSPNVPTAGSFMNMASRLPGYAFPYGALPMAYLQSQMNPFYKDWSEKVQSAVAHAQANTTQQNINLVKASSRAECELSKAERQKRHRAFIDPVSEIPKLEQWFTKDTHPSHYVIEQICDDLNRGEFRSRYPKLSPKNIQLWFKNHRAKVKRMRVGGGKLNLSFSSSQLSPPSGLSLTMME